MAATLSASPATEMGTVDLLRRGLAAGAAAGFAAAVVLYLLVEPVIKRALVIEEARDKGHGHEHAEEVVTRGQQVIGGMLTTVVIGALFGLVFAVVYAKVRHRMPAVTEHGRVLWLAAFGFFPFALFPALAIPSNPPAVGDTATVHQRSLIYVLAILVGVALVLAAFSLERVLSSRGVAAARRTALVVLAFVVAVGVALVVLPDSPDVIPSDVPPAVIWDFRLASVAQLGVMWLALGVVFGLFMAPRTERDRLPARHA
jgi:predicted cobalt transporter CbtA